MPRFLCVIIFLFSLGVSVQSASAGLYLTQEMTNIVHMRDMTLHYTPKNRDLNIRIRWPEGGEKLPVIIFSHGAFGSRDSYAPLVTYWVKRGYVVIQPTHQDSITEGTVPAIDNMLVFREWDERPKEISWLISHIDDIYLKMPAMMKIMDKKRIGVGGHSFGAQTTLLLAGAAARSWRDDWLSFYDPRPLAYVMISPQGEGKRFSKSSFRTLADPALFITGSKDISPFDKDKHYSWRLTPFREASPGNKYQVFIEDAYHNFGGISGMRSDRPQPYNTRHLQIVRTTTLAFFDAWVKGKPAARQWFTDYQTLQNYSGFQLMVK